MFVTDEMIREFLRKALKDQPNDYATLREIERRVFPHAQSRL